MSVRIVGFQFQPADGEFKLTEACKHQWISAFAPTLEKVLAASEALEPARAEFLLNAAKQIAASLSSSTKSSSTKSTNTEIGLNFICTHNSRRSHLGQVWSAIGSHYYGLPQIKSYSGGTEATACNERIVRCLREFGLSIVALDPVVSNPLYWLQFDESAYPIRLFSKRYDDSENPPQDFWGMMCCSDADEKCPLITGALGRVALHYRDPKESDESPAEAATYAERAREIGAEMLFLHRNIAEFVQD